MSRYLDSDELALKRGLELTNFVPRQIPSEAEAQAIMEVGSSMGAASGGAMFGTFAVSLILAASLNQLWSMMNGL